MMLFNIMGLVLIIIIIGFGLYYLLFKKIKNRYSTILGYSYLFVGAIGLFIMTSLW
ncbi:hypothetical protein MHH81_08860 [Psychrobacillus sp. FSL H8-0484]|uniref:hypothetical protein n=1 Tax=Psychrobacillus sp. FSL H8-0484 TaxID=2921390 RepID=UPI0030F4B79E